MHSIFFAEVLFPVSEYRADNMCWLHKYSLYFGFLFPAGILLLVNIGFFISILRNVVWKKKKVILWHFSNAQMITKDILINVASQNIDLQGLILVLMARVLNHV